VHFVEDGERGIGKCFVDDGDGQQVWVVVEEPVFWRWGVSVVGW
jgi:hypothetical protein